MEILKLEQQIFFLNDDFVNGNIKPQKMLEAFQNIAIAHAKQIGVGFDKMMEKGLIWVVLKIKYEISRKIEPNKTYNLITYPKKKSRLTFDRDYYIFDGDRVCAKCTSVWCVVNFLTRSLVRPDFDFEGDVFEQKAFNSPLGKIELEDMNNSGVFEISKMDIDENNHTNNTVYSKMMEQVLGVENFASVQINFLKETKLGDKIDLFVNSACDTVCGKMGEEVIFSAHVEK